MDIDTLISKLPESYTVVDRDLIVRAYKFAEKAHEGQKRLSGEPYITHCLAVAEILVDLQVPPEMIAAALLHDTVEDTPVTLEDLENKFSPEIAKLVDGVTKLTNLPRVSRADQMVGEKAIASRSADTEDEDDDSPASQLARSRHHELANETLRKMLLAMGDDIRVVVIKLADRLHNMRTLSHMPEKKRYSIAKETLDIFAPLANRIGIWQLKWELEDLSLRYLKPDIYKEIAQKLSDRRKDREEEIALIIKDLDSVMKKGKIEAEITGRPKHIYSIYRKMTDKGMPFEMVRDLRGVRLIVPDIPSCYAALGLIHTHWRPIPNEFDDYIAAPKDNFYRSLHTAVLYSDGKTLEVQIRTPEMNENAEFGIAAHWIYKEKKPFTDTYQQRINWLRKLMDWKQDVDDAQEFVDGMKSDVFEDRVYVFTPRGDIIDLPRGSTPIDFAYHVHTEIGNRCRGAKVNGKLVSLDYHLQTGDQLEILTAKHGGPSRDWLNINLGLVKTQRARSKIRQWFKKQDEEQNLNQGRNILDKEFHRLGLENVNVENLAHSLDLKNEEELYISLGTGDLSIRKLVSKLDDVEKGTEDPLFKIHAPVTENEASDTVSVLGLKGILTHFARCCSPAPGDAIVGYITRGRGVTIHRQDCPNMLSVKDHERIIKVNWGEAHRTFPVDIQIKAYDRQGLMNDISTIISNENINLRDIKINLSNNLAVINLTLDITDISQLSRVLTRIESLPNIMEAFRFRPG
ncbi:MAG: bifunctional (p)ppGpp synthetase/guanosine-3',5'-bis(diphosphate) 3'-pyrophosphohydrolase [Pelolinea sp.]|jgi:GTP pyrophosphokinase|nr:bifunctional (p)ppGpp synthetase/guanosine-3',5'-bis(diphosphate) 3'-pyrophosphohydrolase [Pelolinea sp.]